jgi:Fic family protein
MIDEKRHSRAEGISVVADPVGKAEAEVRNGFRQYDLVIAMAQDAIDRGKFKLRPSAVLSLHREALRDLSAYAGNYRPAGVEIQKSRHKPPGAHLVPELVEEMSDYVNENWEKATAIHLASYVMWRLNWIHPFDDGNGRTSRAVSFLVLMVKAGIVFTGPNSIPEQISADRSGYYTALDAADEAAALGKTDVSAMEELMSGMLAKQLLSIYSKAGGSTGAAPSVFS